MKITKENLQIYLPFALAIGVGVYEVYKARREQSHTKLSDKNTRSGLKLVGRFPRAVAKAINKPIKSIYVNDETLEKITTRHLPKLEIIGIDAIGFIKLILQNFTQILEDDSNGSLVLVYEPYEKSPKVAALQISREGKYYYIASAFPTTQSYIGNKRLIWVQK